MTTDEREYVITATATTVAAIAVALLHSDTKIGAEAREVLQNNAINLSTAIVTYASSRAKEETAEIMSKLFSDDDDDEIH